MAAEYCLVCNTCKEFLDIHKLRLTAQKCEKYPLEIDGVPISSSEIDEGLKELKIEIGNSDHQWVVDLLPHIEKFSREHTLHRMSMVDDGGPDYYWWPEHTGYTEWKEIRGSLENELFLPRNLVDDLQIADWTAAERYLRSLKIVLYDELELQEYEGAFRKLALFGRE